MSTGPFLDTTKYRTSVRYFCCVSLLSTHFGAATQIRTADLILTKRPRNFFLTIFSAFWPYLLKTIFFPSLFEHKVSACSAAFCGGLCGQSVGRVDLRDLTVCTKVVKLRIFFPAAKHLRSRFSTGFRKAAFETVMTKKSLVGACNTYFP